MKKNLVLLALLSGSAMAQIVPEEGAELVVWANPGENAEVARYAADKFEQKYDVEIQVREVSVLGSVDQMIQDGGSTVLVTYSSSS
ncbi:maltose/maltodextrin ABC transporter [Vibrio ishigakensis]|uniref:Maltose/maltodextrin ABC transporter n=1 Tax=Vibrio ishigakensis TaxID=1481914 RepID=A0A0B8NWT4_9VIBR|nr:maltose/maltodextrin ABC transporter [Vibrio ishigakensis]